MIRIILKNKSACKFTAAVVITSILSITSAFAQTASPVFAVELVVSEGKKSVETDADLTFGPESFTIVPDKTTFGSQAKTIKYSDIKVVDKSYSKKPMLSGGGAIATALLLSVFLAVPLLFVKKKKHWMTVQGEKDYAVIKLGDRNYKQIMAEFETKGVKVNDLGNEKDIKKVSK
jgi:hypothetical protein